MNRSDSHLFFLISCILRYVLLITLENHNDSFLRNTSMFLFKRIATRRDCEMIMSLSLHVRRFVSMKSLPRIVVCMIYKSFRPSSKRFSLANIKYKAVIFSSLSLFFHLYARVFVLQDI